MQYFLAGGAVRDVLLGVRPGEFDVVFNATDEDFLRLYSQEVYVVGKNKQNYIKNGRDHAPLGKSFEENLAGRDLTINALLMEENGLIHALPSTFSDLAQGIIRHASPTAFFDDPARIFRAARFSAVLPGFFIAPETIIHMRDAAKAPNFNLLAGERVGKEWRKALAGHAPGNFLRALARAECLTPWFFFASAAGQEKLLSESATFFHMCDAMDAIAARSDAATISENERVLAVWMAFCRGLNKAATSRDEAFKHAAVRSLKTRLCLPKTWEQAGLIAATWHMNVEEYVKLHSEAKVDFLAALAKNRLIAPFCLMIASYFQDMTIADQIRRDMEIFFSIKLPEEWWNKGPLSAEKHRELRIRALAFQ